MHSTSNRLFGKDSLIGHVMYNNSLWTGVRKSYRQMQLHQRELEEFLKKPVDSFTIRKADDIFLNIRFHWATIKVAKRDFEKTLHKYKCTIPSDLEMALYRQYLLFGNRILESCIASLTKAGIYHPKIQ